MATTTLTLGISSDITSNAIDIATSMTVTTDGTTGVSETSGIARQLIGTGNTVLFDISADPVDLIAKKAVLYIKNCDATFTDYVDVKIGDVSGANHAESLRRSVCNTSSCKQH